MTRRLLLVFPLLVACDLEPENLGAENVEAAAASWDVQWRETADPLSSYYDVAALPDGSALVMEFDSVYGNTTLRRFMADGSSSALVSERSGRPDRIVPTSSSLFCSFDGADGPSRATVRRYGLDGAREAEYEHPREGDANAFPRGLAVSDDEVALVIGNWGHLAPGEPWYMVQRLDLDLQPLGEPIPFEYAIEDVAYDASGTLLVLDAPDGELGRLHRVGTGEPPQSVACDTFLVEHGGSLCASFRVPAAIVDFETHTTVQASPTNFEVSALPARTPSGALFYGLEGQRGPGHVIEVDDDGEIIRTAHIDFGPDVFALSPVSIAATPDGGAYAVVFEHVEEDTCDLDGNECPRSHLVRLVP